ncbi:hypothetical protein C7H19_25080 [Aphanothece hegewaldii CCALA 016]|uniref:Uncharacterized protein n=1 Tax=Aphanothece hegewaldii CCALA 016 TaxID=2107694 RepID=A0A2T1LQG9_9CHRO|nr:hypothetical protein C7H19_25080 [Aphanothece hegewaldii CCALA 016]
MLNLFFSTFFLLLLLIKCSNDFDSLPVSTTDSPQEVNSLPVSRKIQPITEKSFGFELIAVLAIGALILRK